MLAFHYEKLKNNFLDTSARQIKLKLYEQQFKNVSSNLKLTWAFFNFINIKWRIKDEMSEIKNNELEMIDRNNPITVSNVQQFLYK